MADDDEEKRRAEQVVARAWVYDDDERSRSRRYREALHREAPDVATVLARLSRERVAEIEGDAAAVEAWRRLAAECPRSLPWEAHAVGDYHHRAVDGAAICACGNWSYAEDVTGAQAEADRASGTPRHSASDHRVGIDEARAEWVAALLDVKVSRLHPGDGPQVHVVLRETVRVIDEVVRVVLGEPTGPDYETRSIRQGLDALERAARAIEASPAFAPPARVAVLQARLRRLEAEVEALDRDEDLDADPEAARRQRERLRGLLARLRGEIERA